MKHYSLKTGDVRIPRLLKAIDGELKFRTQRGCHFEEDGGRRG